MNGLEWGDMVKHGGNPDTYWVKRIKVCFGTDFSDEYINCG